MKLHRTGGQADWMRLSRRRWNVWQRLAGKTAGIVTPGNAFTCVGLVMVAIALICIAKQQYMAGLALLAGGRLCDLLDGWLAERTGTKSPLGEMVDATADKLAVAATLVVLVTIHIVPVWLAMLVLVAHSAISWLGSVAVAQSFQLHPSRTGKLGMAAVWLGFVLLVAIAAFQSLQVWPWTALAYAVCCLSVLLTSWTAVGYYRQLFGRR